MACKRGSLPLNSFHAEQRHSFFAGHRLLLEAPCTAQHTCMAALLYLFLFHLQVAQDLCTLTAHRGSAL